MTLIVFFIFAAVIIGAGAMLSPAYPSSQPRIGLSATLALALVAGGAVFYGTAVNWNTLVVDYMLFLLVMTIFLGGTLSYGQKRAEARGEELPDEEQGWPGPFDLLGLIGAMGLFIAVAYFFGTTDPRLMFDVASINSGDLTLYGTGTPAYTTIAAYLSGQLTAPMPDVQKAMAAVLASIVLWLAYDLGAEISAKPLGRIFALIATPLLVIPVAIGAGAHLMGIAFLIALLVFSMRYARDGGRVDLVTSGLMLGAVVLTVPPLPLLALAIVAGAAIYAAVRVSPVRGIVFVVAVAVVAALATLPTLMNYGWTLV